MNFKNDNLCRSPNDFVFSGDDALFYLRRKIDTLRLSGTSGQDSKAAVIEEELQRRVKEVTEKLAYEVGSGKLTIRL